MASKAGASSLVSNRKELSKSSFLNRNTGLLYSQKLRPINTKNRANRVDCQADTGVGSIAPFKLERWFAEYEFSAPHLLCCSDCEPLSLKELLAMGDADSLEKWDNLSLGYTESPGLPELREQIAGMYSLASSEDVLVVVPEEGVYLTMLALLRPGDHVVVTFPGYQSLYELANSIGCKVDTWQPEYTSDGLAFNVDSLEAMVTPTTKAVIVNFPHNPTGCLLSQDDWTRVVAAASKVGAHLFCDEMYRGFELDDSQAQLTAGVDSYERAVTLCGMSKLYSLPGLRIGWLATRDEALMARLRELKDYTTICSSAPSEVLALMGLRAGEEIISQNLSLMRSNLELLEKFFASHSDKFTWHPPKGSTIAFPELVLDGSSEEWCRSLVEQTGILLLPAAAYDYQPEDGRQHFRVGFGRKNVPEVLELLDGHIRS